MFNIINDYGEELKLLGNSCFDIIGCTGLNPQPAEIALNNNPQNDGGTISSAYVRSRNIVLTLRIKKPIEQNRNKLYEFLMTSSHVTVCIRNEIRLMKTEGTIEMFDNDHFTMIQKPQISIICPNPFFESEELKTYSFSENEESYLVNNNGHAMTDCEVSLTAIDDNVVFPVYVQNYTTGQTFTLTGNLTVLTSGDKIVLNSKTLSANVVTTGGTIIPIIKGVANTSEWITLAKGKNVLKITSTNENNIAVSVSFYERFGGV